MFLPALALVVLTSCGPTTVETPAGSSDASVEDSDPATPVESVVITEIMYHPVLEEDYVDNHEFVELHNPGSAAIALDGWSVSGIGYDLPEDAVLEAGAFLVLAKNPTALVAVAEYGLTAGQVLGPYDGQLDNGGETLALERPDGTISDRVDYRDESPWPIAADALGAGESWLAPELLPLESHRHRGVSLERVSVRADGAEPASWVASDVDAPSPGAAFTGLRDEPQPIVEAFETTSLDGQVIGAGDQVQLTLRFSQVGVLSQVSVEYFVDDLEASDEATVSLPIDAADLEDRQATVVLPGLPAESIVRFRVVADRGDGAELVSPRPTDPYGFHGYFVEPEVSAQTRLYQLYVAPDDWTRLWTNLDGGRELGCEASETWNDKVPAVFIFEGQVYDVRIRYQGSRWGRTDGAALGSWPYPGPSEPEELVALSFRVGFPRYHRLEGRKALNLNELKAGCPGLTAGVGFELFRQAGLPAPSTRYVRLHINGGYYRYMLEIERPGETLMEAWQDQVADQEGLDPPEELGHLYKAVGLNYDAGPFGWGDSRPLEDFCGHSAYDRYTWTYERKTWTWESHDPLIQMIEDLDAFRDADGRLVDVAGTRDYLAASFDVESMLDHIAVMNWSVPADDYFHNHYLYQRSDGRWMFMAWDLDMNFGEWAEESGGGPQASIFGGRNGELVAGGIDANRRGWWNRVKDSFLVAYEDEFILRIKALNETVLHPANINDLITAVEADYDEQEAGLAASPPSCDMASEAAGFRAFAGDRHQYVRDTEAADLVDW
jgi:hypothetical protein